MESSKYTQYKSALFSVKSIIIQTEKLFYIFVNITNSIKDMFIISMTMDPQVYYLQTHRCQLKLG